MNVSAGNYKLDILDARQCGHAELNITVNDDSKVIDPPSVTDQHLCGPGNSIITVNNPNANTRYRVYDSPNSITPIDEQTGGKFNLKITENQTFYFTQFSGTCESARTSVQVTLGLSKADIPTVITPNGDGINDTWTLKGLINYPKSNVKIYNRYGQQVYESNGYSIPFDGKLNGKPLSAGTYYYIMSLDTDCNLLSGSLTIIR